MIELLTKLTAPWAQLYSDHAWIGVAVIFLHLTGILWGGGRAIVADRVVLRLPDIDAFSVDGLEFLRTSHRDVLVGLGVIIASGLLLLASEIDEFITSPIYWTKMALFVSLLVNGAFFNRLEEAVDGGGPAAVKAWRRIRLHSTISIGLWMAVLLLGIILTGV